jgi:hypothetical protein
VAQKLGGVHWDPSRDEKEDMLESLNARTSVNGLPPIYNELLSYGQQLLESPDTAKFLKTVGADPV